MNERENAYEEEINLSDLLFHCLKKWRWIAATMLIIALLAGAYKYYSTQKSNQAALEQWAELETEGDTEEKLEEKTTIDNLDILQYYQSVVERNDWNLQAQGEYVEDSALMRMDAKNLQKGTLSFTLKTKNADQKNNVLNMLIAAYRAYVTDGRLAQLLYSEDEDMVLSDSQYLVSFSYDGSMTPYIDGIENTVKWPDQVLLQIQIIAGNKKECEKYVKTATKAMEAYCDDLQKQVGVHELTLLASSISSTQSQTIQDYQAAVLNNYTAAIRNLSALRTEVKTYADSLETADTADTSEEVLAGPALASPLNAGMKYVILGLVLGAFLAGFILIVLFLMSDRLRSTDNFENKFGMRLLGRIVEPLGGKGLFRVFDQGIQRLCEGAYANLPYEEQIKIVSENVKTALPSKEGLHRVMIAGTIAAKDVKEVCAAIVKEIDGVVFSDYRQLIFDASALEELNECDGILFIEKKDVSSNRLIYQEGKMAADRNVKILGAVVM